MAFTALFDACVLYPAPLRDLLVELARTELFRARWTDRIHEEWVRNVQQDRPDLTRERLQRTAVLMNEAIEDSLVAGYETLIPAITLPDQGDRHVVAAAIAGRADVIVTFNLKDFPAAALAPHGIEAQHPDVFIRHVLDLDIVAFSAPRTVRLRLRKPAMTVEQYLDTLARQGLPETVRCLRQNRLLLA